ncbi:MAG: DUF1553 domain-containing protein, partial [Gemmataceae bacterium]
SPFLETFDRPRPQSPFGRRDLTASAMQSLTLWNDPFIHGQAEAWGKQMQSSPLPVAERAAQMIQTAFGRKPTVDERQQLLQLATDHGWADAARALISAKEFLYVP